VRSIIDGIDDKIEKNIGLKNVHNRLKILYGKGLNIKKLERGTKITFYISKEDKC
jgi:two-component system, LytTR family, sensor kinase